MLVTHLVLTGHASGYIEQCVIPDKQGREIHDQDKTLEGIGEFYTELYEGGILNCFYNCLFISNL